MDQGKSTTLRPDRDRVRAALEADFAEYPALLTVDQTAEILQITSAGTYQAIQQGNLAGVVRAGRNLRVVKSVLLGWMVGIDFAAPSDHKDYPSS